jgi:hypothetical protein
MLHTRSGAVKAQIEALKVAAGRQPADVHGRGAFAAAPVVQPARIESGDRVKALLKYLKYAVQCNKIVLTKSFDCARVIHTRWVTKRHLLLVSPRSSQARRGVGGALQCQIRVAEGTVVGRAIFVLCNAARAQEVLALRVAEVLNNGTGATVCIGVTCRLREVKK